MSAMCASKGNMQSLVAHLCLSNEVKGKSNADLQIVFQSLL